MPLGSQSPARSNMNYNEFKDALVSKVKEQLDASYSVALQTVIKNNGISLDAIIIKSPTYNISPTLYINHLFGAYENGEDIDDIARHIIELNSKFQMESDFDTSSFIDFEKAKSNIIYKLINYDRNRELLSNTPFIEFLDLAIVFYYKVEESYIPDGYIMITNEIMNKWGSTKDELYSLAKENTSRLYKVKVTKVFDLIFDRLSEEEKEIFDLSYDFPLFVLSNEQVFNGANCLLDNNILSSISDMHESSLYIIPSSIHETLFIPEKDTPVDLDYMTEMVKAVNSTELPEHEYLSDHVYFFDRDKKVLSIAG